MGSRLTVDDPDFCCRFPAPFAAGLIRLHTLPSIMAMHMLADFVQWFVVLERKS